MDLTVYFEGAQQATEAVQAILREMDAAYSTGAEEGKARAMALRPALDEARAKAKAANELYVSMRDATAASESAAKQFVPTADLGTPAPASAQTLQRQAFSALPLVEQARYIQSGGVVAD